jgi:CHAD domain-containing protein
VRAATTLDPRHPEAEEAVHRARKSAKRARYVAELARPRLGGKAKTVIAETTKLQDRLGSHQDSVIAMEFLLRVQAAAAAAGENPFTYGVLWSNEHATAAAARSAT